MENPMPDIHFEVTDVTDARARDFQMDRTAAVVSLDNRMLDRVIEASEATEDDALAVGRAVIEKAAEWRATERIRRAGARARA